MTINEDTGPVDKNIELHVFSLIQLSKPNAVTYDEIVKETSEDSELNMLKKKISSSKWDGDKIYGYFKNELCEAHNLILRGNKIVIPRSLRYRTLQLAHQGHPGIVVMKRLLREKVWWPNIDKEVEQFVKNCNGCQLVQISSPPFLVHQCVDVNYPKNHGKI